MPDIRNRIPCKANDGWTQPAVAIDKNKMTKITENESEINKDGIIKTNDATPKKAKGQCLGDPRISHIVEFGSNCTAHIAPGDKQIAQRADVGVIVGVNDEIKGYNVWIPAAIKWWQRGM